MLILPWIATVNAFQHWIYTLPDHSRADRKAAWRSLLERFGGSVDWSGHEEARDHSWHRQIHIFLYPFYYIEYGIAELGALADLAALAHRSARARSPTTSARWRWEDRALCPSCSQPRASGSISVPRSSPR